MLSDFETKILDFSNTHNLFETGAPILLAVSGGADSVAMMNVIANLQQKRKLDIHLAVAHVNHTLRAESADADEEFVAQLAEKMALKVLTRTVDTRDCAKREKISIETAARKLRIDALTDMAREAQCRYVATAHHADDNAETLVHRLLRGTAFRGLAGIRPSQKFENADIAFVRPMLCVTRAEIIDYCQAENLSWCQDHTNDEFAYTRNKIRHLFLPYLQKECDAPVTQTFNSLADASRKLYEKIEAQVQNRRSSVVLGKDNETVVFGKESFRKLNPLLQAEFVNAALVSIGSGLGKINQDHYHTIASLSSELTNGKVQLPAGFCVVANHDKITFTKTQSQKQGQLPDEVLTLNIGQSVSFGPWTIETKILNAKDCDIEKFKADKDSFIEWFDYDKLFFPLTVRSRRDGDKFRPLGYPAPKRIGKFLTTAKVSSSVRSVLTVFADTQKIIWVAPVRASELAKITTDTKKILQIKIR